MDCIQVYNQRGGYMDQIFAAIGQYAFPIVMCVCMGWYVKYREDKHSEEIATINKDHKDEVSQMTAALNNNTLALTQLADYLKDKRYEN